MYRYLDNSLLGDVITIAHKAMIDKGASNQMADAELNKLGLAAMQRSASEFTENASFEHLNRRFDELQHRFDKSKLSDHRVQEISRLAAMDSIVNNAVQRRLDAETMQTPTQQAQAFLSAYFKKTGLLDASVDMLQEGLDKIIISLVHTMHPTIYHSPEARRFESRLTHLLEESDNTEVTGNRVRLSEAGRKAVASLFNESQEEIAALDDTDPRKTDPSAAFIERLGRNEATITPKKPMTVTLETETEKENIAAIKEEFHDVLVGWNIAVQNQVGLTDEQRQKLTLDEKRMKDMLEMRTWGQSADADGREKSTSQFLYECIQNNLDQDGHYAGPMLDMRNNKEVHEDFFSALVQVKFRNALPGRNAHGTGLKNMRRYGEDVPNETTGQTFDVFTKKFMEQRSTEPAYQRDDARNWNGPDHSIFQQLVENDKYDFVKAILKSGYDLVPDQLKKDVLEFNPLSYQLKKNFFDTLISNFNDIDSLKKHHITKEKGFDLKTATFGDLARRQGYDPATITYDEMLNVSIPLQGKMTSMRGAWDLLLKRNGWMLNDRGRRYNRLPEPLITKEGEPLVDFVEHEDSASHILMQNFLQGTKKIVNKDGVLEKRELVDTERTQLMDVAKRLIVASDAIDRYGNGVATRHQIANFSEPSDFLIALKLFEEAGLVDVEKGTGKVTKTKMGIMPLLETKEDLQNAEAIFTTLLEDRDHIAESYWKARGEQMGMKDGKGYAEIMLGYSDGAATNGNMASLWAMHKATQQLTDLFEKHGIKVRFLHGRGRGFDRGGTVDPSLQNELLPPDVTQGGIYDVTVQSDLPMDMAASASYGRDYLSKAFLSSLEKTVSPPELDEQREKRLHQKEVALNWIANRASDFYNEVVRNNPMSLTLFNNLPDNPNRSSRATARGGAKVFANFDKVRAIPKEFLLNEMDLPAHNVGIGKAMDEFVRQWDMDGNWKGDGEEIIIEDENGNKLTKQKALAEVLTHPFAKAMMQITRSGIQNFDPSVAGAYGRLTGTEDWVKEVMTHLVGLGDKIDRHTGNTGFRAGQRQEFRDLAKQNEKAIVPAEKHPGAFGSALDQIAHAIIVQGLSQNDPNKTRAPNFSLDNQRIWGDTLYNALFTNAQEVGRRSLVPAQGQQSAQAMVG